MESQEIIEAAKKRLPVVYDGVVYKEILEYILWFELSKKLAELNIEFCKTLNANNGTEALRWISTTMEFLEAVLAESVDSGSLTQNERGVLLATKASSKNHCDNLQSLLQRRKERRTS